MDNITTNITEILILLFILITFLSELNEEYGGEDIEETEEVASED